MTVPPNPAVQNVLFIMCDQLRLDALSCYGGMIDTPNIDALAARGVRFDKAFVQGVVCGSSRMSWYTGRYVHSHGVRYNRIPLAVGQRTLGDHLRPLGVRPVLIGKTHMAADTAGFEWLGLDPDAPEAIYLAECGFEPEERDDGLHTAREVRADLPYNLFLREHGFTGPNPWHSAANSVLDENGQQISGWLLRSSKYPSIVPDELSETAFMTNRAIEFMRNAGHERWCMHLSFIKPHWPYVVSEPYHQMVDPLDLPAPHRSDAELRTDHPVLNAFRKSRVGAVMSRDEVRRSVYPAYLGLVKQIDDHLGRLFASMKELGRDQDTMIVFTADHGDYLGDHWMGEKDWFHEEIANVPLIVADPRPSADATRGTSTSQLVEAIDIVPTFVDALGGDLDATSQWLEGRTLSPMLSGRAESPAVEPPGAAVISEADFAGLEMSALLPEGPRHNRRATMLRTDRYKYILCEVGPNLLYDLDADPDEFTDRHDDPALVDVQRELHDQLFEWYRRRSHDVTHRPSTTKAHPPPAPGQVARNGFFIGYWDEAQAAADNADHLLSDG